jgi:RimJ/RimL family protein N-acetyltransferase
VLLDEQDGVVWAEKAEAPEAVYVEHAFGFAQLLGGGVIDFEKALESYLLAEQRFTAPKVRLYTPRLPDFLADPANDSMRAFRQRFFIDRRSARVPSEAGAPPGFSAAGVDAGNIDFVENAFGVVRRFWRSPEDFIRNSQAVAVLHRGRPASICYAAAVADRRAEIDVLTLPEFRNLGAGKFAAMRFIAQCFERGLVPLWDCFINNAASMRLSRSLGFYAPKPPYPFYTIDRRPPPGDRRK